jgi:hypothetical protein
MDPDRPDHLDTQPITPQQLVPWDTPQGHPLRALADTLWMCLRHPMDFFALIPNSQDRWGAVGYALILHVIGFSATAVWSSVIGGELDTLALLRVVIAPLWVLASVWLGSEMMHGFLSLFRGTKLPRTITHRAVAYCYSTAALGLIPVVGIRVGLFLSAVYQIMALRQAHRTSFLKAALAVLLTWGTLLGLVLLAALSGQPLDDE